MQYVVPCNIASAAYNILFFIHDLELAYVYTTLRYRSKNEISWPTVTGKNIGNAFLPTWKGYPWKYAYTYFRRWITVVSEDPTKIANRICQDHGYNHHEMQLFRKHSLDHKKFLFWHQIMGKAAPPPLYNSCDETKYHHDRRFSYITSPSAKMPNFMQNTLFLLWKKNLFSKSWSTRILLYIWRQSLTSVSASSTTQLRVTFNDLHPIYNPLSCRPTMSKISTRMTWICFLLRVETFIWWPTRKQVRLSCSIIQYYTIILKCPL